MLFGQFEPFYISVYLTTVGGIKPTTVCVEDCNWQVFALLINLSIIFTINCWISLCWLSSACNAISEHKCEQTSARHLFALGVVCADVGEFPADVEQHVVLSRSPLLHKVCGEHPGPEHDAVILKTACKHTQTLR